MSKLIYTSEFKTGPEATKKQQMLFAADTEFALSEGYVYIKASDGFIFQMVDAENLIEVPYTEEQILAAEQDIVEVPKEVEFDPELTNADELLNHNLFLIQSIINNTLSQKEPITISQVKTMTGLAVLSNQLLAGSV